MINIDYLRNGGTIISQIYINKTKDLEQKIDNNLLKKKVEYLFMSNALKELKSLKPKFTNKNI